MKTLINLLSLLAIALPASAHAADVSGLSRTYTYSCGYYSSRVSDVQIEYKNTDLEWGVIVQMIYGYEGEDVRGGGDDVRRIRYEWQQENSVVVAASDSYTWTGKVQVPVHYRSSSSFNDHLNFVYRIIHPDGRIEFDNGTSTPWGFYRLKLAINDGCTDSVTPLPDFRQADVTTVERY